MHNRIQAHLGGGAPTPAPPAPSSWDAGPPQTPRENWQWQRRSELLHMATVFSTRELVTMGGAEDPQETARRAVEQAVALQAALDAARPRS